MAIVKIKSVPLREYQKVPVFSKTSARLCLERDNRVLFRFLIRI